MYIFTEESIIYKAPASYSDHTYIPAGASRPNARLISNRVLSGQSGLPSYVNHTALFAFFGIYNKFILLITYIA